MNSENSKTSGSYGLLLNLADKINLNRSDNMLLYQILVCTIRENIFKNSYKNNKFKIQAPSWNEKFVILYSESDIQDYFEYILRKHREKTGILRIRTLGRTQRR